VRQQTSAVRRPSGQRSERETGSGRAAHTPSRPARSGHMTIGVSRWGHCAEIIMVATLTWAKTTIDGLTSSKSISKKGIS
jgi:hypothetical protein